MKKELLVLMLVLMVSCTTYQYTPYTGTNTLTCPNGEVLTCSESKEAVPTGEVISEKPLEEISEEELVEELEDIETELVEIPLEDEPLNEDAGEVPLEEEVTEEVTELPEADITAYEGELVEIKTNVKDADGDELTITFGEPLDEEGKWQTEKGDAGFYSVEVTVTDGKVQVKKDITILVLEAEGLILDINGVTVNEGETVVLAPVVDEGVEVTYSGWMDTNEKVTGFDDAGIYTVTVTAAKDDEAVSKEITVTVVDVNRAPTLNILNAVDGKVTVREGDLAELEIEAADEDNDEITITMSEPFEEGTWQTEAGDLGEYEVLVTASDGKAETEVEVLIEVTLSNHAPVIKNVIIEPGTDIQLETQDDEVTITIVTVATDADGDDVEISYSGWMEENTKTVAWGEEGGDHEVTVTVSDGIETVTKVVTISVNSWPVFI